MKTLHAAILGAALPLLLFLMPLTCCAYSGFSLLMSFQPDPKGADGNQMFIGWGNFLTCVLPYLICYGVATGLVVGVYLKEYSNFWNS